MTVYSSWSVFNLLDKCFGSYLGSTWFCLQFHDAGIRLTLDAAYGFSFHLPTASLLYRLWKGSYSQWRGTCEYISDSQSLNLVLYFNLLIRHFFSRRNLSCQTHQHKDSPANLQSTSRLIYYGPINVCLLIWAVGYLRPIDTVSFKTQKEHTEMCFQY